MSWGGASAGPGGELETLTHPYWPSLSQSCVRRMPVDDRAMGALLRACCSAALWATWAAAATVAKASASPSFAPLLGFIPAPHASDAQARATAEGTAMRTTSV